MVLPCGFMKANDYKKTGSWCSPKNRTEGDCWRVEWTEARNVLALMGKTPTEMKVPWMQWDDQYSIHHSAREGGPVSWLHLGLDHSTWWGGNQWCELTLQTEEPTVTQHRKWFAQLIEVENPEPWDSEDGEMEMDFRRQEPEGCPR